MSSLFLPSSLDTPLSRTTHTTKRWIRPADVESASQSVAACTSSSSPSAAAASSSVWRELLSVLTASLLFVAVICALHYHTINSHTQYQQSKQRTMASTSAASFDLSTDSSSLHRQLLSADPSVATPAVTAPAVAAPAVAADTPPPGYIDIRTPAQRCQSRNPHSPFISAKEKVLKYAEWEVAFQVLLDQHRDARTALAHWLGPAVNDARLNSAPLWATNQTVALLDGRTDPLFIFLIKHLFHMLGPGWGLIIFHTQSNQEWWVDQLDIRPGGGGEWVDLQRVDPIQFQQANSLATSPAFYERIPCETILLIQPDTMALRSEYWPGAMTGGPSLSELLSRYVYLGSPWSWCNEEWCKVGGNGGFSLRKRSVMLDLTRQLQCSDWECHYREEFEHFSHQQEIKMKHVEDTFFSWQIYDHRYKWSNGPTSQIADPITHGYFSFEAYDLMEIVQPWFVHKIWNYMSHLRYGPMMARTIQFYPELWMTPQRLEEFKKECA